MKVVVAIDSLKGSLSSLEAGEAISEGIKKVNPDAQVEVRPLADGGEGTVEALTRGMNGRLETVTVTGPLGEKVEASYGILEASKQNGKKTAIIEMSAAAGITLVEDQNRNPMKTTTVGVGEMIKDAIRKGCRHFIVGIGGSVTNALCGEQGCSAVFGPHKGATPTMIMQMDKWMAYTDTDYLYRNVSGQMVRGIHVDADTGHSYDPYEKTAIHSEPCVSTVNASDLLRTLKIMQHVGKEYLKSHGKEKLLTKRVWI